MKGIMEVCIGGVGIAYGSYSTKAAGVGLVGDGLRRFGNATIDYFYPEPSERDRSRERDRDGERPSMADRER